MFRHVVVAGTFDRLHKGHEAVLRRAFAEGERVTIGLTTDAFVRRYKLDKLAQLDKLDITEYSERKKALVLWLAAQNYAGRATIIPLDDPHGPVIPKSPHDPAVPDIEAIIISTETRPRAEEINQLRIEAGWKPLVIIEVAMVPAEDLQALSSTRVRAGVIDRGGRLVMPDNLRPQLQKPLGRVLTGNEIARSIAAKQGSTLITVGDVATKTLLDMGVVPVLSIIDGKVERKTYIEAKNQLLHLGVAVTTVQSGPGYISGEATRAIKATQARPAAQGRLEKQKAVIVVDGEEDLLALPAIAEAPVGSVVYYGQPRIASVRGKPHGLVEVVVDKKKKEIATALLLKFEALTK